MRTDEYIERVPLRAELADCLPLMPQVEGKVVNPLWAPERHQLRLLREWRVYFRSGRPKPGWVYDKRLKDLSERLLGRDDDGTPEAQNGGPQQRVDVPRSAGPVRREPGSGTEVVGAGEFLDLDDLPEKEGNAL